MRALPPLPWDVALCEALNVKVFLARVLWQARSSMRCCDCVHQRHYISIQIYVQSKISQRLGAETVGHVGSHTPIGRAKFRPRVQNLEGQNSPHANILSSICSGKLPLRKRRPPFTQNLPWDYHFRIHRKFHTLLLNVYHQIEIKLLINGPTYLILST